MRLVFIIKSATVEITNYTIKDIPGSSGRLDVISRCILAGLMGNNSFDKNVQVWIFLGNYGTLMFDSNVLNLADFPKNELLLSDFIVRLIKDQELNSDIVYHPQPKLRSSYSGIIEIIERYISQNYAIYILQENGEDFSEELNKLIIQKNLLFILGDQSGDFLNSKKLIELNLPTLSFGSQSYLASSIIRLIKLNLLYLV